MNEWLRPILGAALLLAGAAGLAYKVISGYQRASPDAFFSVNDQKRVPAASAADRPAQAATVPADVTTTVPSDIVAPAPARSAAATPAAPAQSAPIVAQSAPIAAAPPAVPVKTMSVASRAATNTAPPTDAQDNPACLPIEAEQREIQAALKRQYSPEQGRFMQRRLRELAEQSVNLKCAE